MLYKDIHDVNDGFQGTTAACREYTLLHEDPNSKITVWVERHTKIGPVLHVQTGHCLDVLGIEIRIPSTFGDG